MENSLAAQFRRITLRGNSSEDDHDRLSNLPDPILSDILSRLCTKDALRTSVLSKDWKYKWTFNQGIRLSDDRKCRRFSDHETKKANFVNIVERAIRLSQNLQSLSLSCYDRYPSCRLRTWICAALSRDVSSLQILYDHDVAINFDLLFTHFNRYSLRKLGLVMCCIFKVPTESDFPYLTTLKLEKVEITNELYSPDTVLKFNFPVLETFELIGCVWLHVKSMEIYAPKLTSFTSSSKLDIEMNDCAIKIIGDSLVNVISCGVIPENIVLSGGSKVAYAYLRNSWRKDDLHSLEASGLRIRKLLTGLSSLEELELTGYLAQAIALARRGDPLPKFYKMKQLFLTYTFSANPEALLALLHAMPFLKILKIRADLWEDYDYDAEKRVPLCIASRLETVWFGCCDKSIHKMLELAKFFLKNAVQLKKVVWKKNSLGPFFKNQIREELSPYLQASTSLTFVAPEAFLPSFLLQRGRGSRCDF